MANLIIKPTSGGSLILHDEGGDAALTVGTTGVSTIANATITTGTIAAATAFPAGHIIQTVSYVNGTQVGTASTSFSTSNKVSFGAITPQYANSDILISGHISLSANANAAYVFADIYKNASDVTETANLTGYANGIIHMNDAVVWATTGYSWLDTCSENSTSAKTYGISVRAHSSGGSATIGWGSSGASVMILQEIKR